MANKKFPEDAGLDDSRLSFVRALEVCYLVLQNRREFHRFEAAQTAPL